MAEMENRQIIEVDVSKSVASLRQLRDQITQMQVELIKLSGANKDTTKTQIDLKAAQTEYNRVMRLSVKEVQAVQKEQASEKRSLEQIKSETQATGQSYNALSVQLAKLKEEWKATGDAAKRAQIGDEVNKVKAQMTELDHSIGNYHDKVGNYENAIVAALNRMGIGVKGLGLSFKAIIPSIKAVGAALWSLAKNPFILGLTAIIALFNKISKSLKGNEEAYDRIRIALAPLKTITIAVQRAFDALVGKIADAAEGVGRFLEKIGLVKGTAKELKDIATEEDALEQMRRDYRIQEAADQKEINRLRVESLKETEYTAKQRKEMLEQAEALEIGIGKRREEQAKRENELAKRKAALTANSRETNDALAESEAKVDNAMGQTYASMVRLESRLNSLSKSTGDAADEMAQSAEGLLATLQAAITAIGLKGADDLLAEDAKIEEKVNEQIDAEIKAWEDGIKKREAARAKAEKEAAKNRGAELAVGTGNINEQAGLAEVNAAWEIQEEEALAARIYEIRRKANEDKLALLREYAQKELEAGNADGWTKYQKQAHDVEVQMQKDAVNEKIRLRKLDTDNAEKAAKQQQEALQATASIFGNVASAYQAYLTKRLEGGKMSEEAAEREFENVKAIQYAQTWINTLAGAMSVWAGEGTTAFKVLQSAAVMSQGIAATMQIANTTLGSTSAASQAITSAAVAAPIVLSTMPQVQALTSASQEDVLNERAASQRVYVVYSDIAQAGRRVQVTQGESRF